MAKKTKPMPQKEESAGKKPGRPKGSTNKKKTTVEQLPDEVSKQPTPVVVDEKTEIMEIPKIEEISPYEGEPQVQSYALPPGSDSQQSNTGNINIQNDDEQPHPIGGNDFPNEQQQPDGGQQQFSDELIAEDHVSSQPFSGMSDDEARQTYRAIVEQYNFTTGNLLPEIPGLAVKPGKELYQLNEDTQQAFLEYVQKFNAECFGALKINEEDNNLLEEPSIYMIKKQSSKITMEDRFKMALAQVGVKKIALLIGILRQAKSVTAQINERIRQAAIERKADINAMADMMNKFNSRMQDFESRESKLNSEMSDFQKQKEEWESQHKKEEAKQKEAA